MKKLTKHAHQVLVDLVEREGGKSLYWRYRGNNRRAMDKLIKLGLVDEVGIERLEVTESGRQYVTLHHG